EFALYTERDPTFKCRIVVKHGLASRAITLEKRVELRAEASFSARLAEGLAAHEVGVHALTTHNGGAQPLGVLRYGLPGSRRTQEGLAVFAEYRAGALTPGRLKTLGLRTKLVGHLVEGASFVDAVRLVQKAHALDLDDAYELVFRVYRGGGLTKDGVYLSGFLEVVRYWLAGKDLSVLVAGKVSSDSASIVRDLILRGVLHAPKILPRFLEDEAGLAANRVVFGLTELMSGRNGAVPPPPP
ncbi:MAG: tyrosine/phenylalanine carboxypeptidase domain-containing protein, partial [Planctomycetota bacterium]